MITQCVNCGSNELDKSRNIVYTLSKKQFILGNTKLPTSDEGDTILSKGKEDIYFCMKCSTIHRYINPLFEETIE